MSNPIQLAREVSERYMRYLRSSFHFRDARLQEQFDAELAKSPLTRGPVIEATPTFAPGMRFHELVAELSQSPLPWAQAAAGQWPLYKHQEAAIRKVRSGRNIVVATGTGSGKTESFILPILWHLAERPRRAIARLEPAPWCCIP